MAEDTHENCIMGEKWVWVEEQLKNIENSRLIGDKNFLEKYSNYIASQSKINAETLSAIGELKHYIYEDGLNTKLEVNKLTAANDTLRVESLLVSEVKVVSARLNRIWWGIGVVIILLAGRVASLLLF